MITRTSLPVPTFSSPLTEALSRFLAFKRAAGCRYDDEARALRLLDRFLTTTLDADDPVITLDVVRRYVARRGEESETTRAHRLSLIRQVCRFLALDQPRTAVPAPRFLAIHRRTFVARVLSQEEGRRFLTAWEHLGTRPWSPICNTVLGTVLVLLYFTGLRTGEVLGLTIADVDLVGAVLRVRDTKFGKSRLVPLASDVAARLDRCRTTIERHLGSRSPDAPFFSTASGRPYSHTALTTAFHQVLRAPTFLVTAPAVHSASTISVTDSRSSDCWCGTSKRPIWALACRPWRRTSGTWAWPARNGTCSSRPTWWARSLGGTSAGSDT